MTAGLDFKIEIRPVERRNLNSRILQTKPAKPCQFFGFFPAISYIAKRTRYFTYRMWPFLILCRIVIPKTARQGYESILNFYVMEMFY
jgi:hypothetical protein